MPKRVDCPKWEERYGTDFAAWCEDRGFDVKSLTKRQIAFLRSQWMLGPTEGDKARLEMGLDT